MCRVSIVSAAVAGLLLFGSAYACPRQFEAAAKLLQDAVDDGTVRSAVGLVARGDEILLLDAVGELGPGEPMPVNAIARLASITKAVTATAVLMLVERGQLDLDESVEHWFPDFGKTVLTADGDLVPSHRRPTVRDLLTHEAGLIAGGPQLDALWDARGVQEFARRIGAIPLRFEPGSRFEYGCCGSAYEVLAAIVEQVSGESFKDFLTTNVLAPLGMTDTYFFVPKAKRPRLAANYGVDASGASIVVRAKGQEEPPSEFYSGGGGLRSTVLDYYRFALMLARGGELDGVRLLRPQTVRMMVTNQVGASYPDPDHGWGFGVRIRTTDGSEGSPGKGSFGWNGGTGTRFVVDPELDMIAIVFVPTWPRTPGVDDVRDGFIAAAVAACRDVASTAAH